jgi:transcriptional regulator with GAF, ATPase, and Fis domain/tetratricopeptide (TPR) repeat protein
MERFAGRFVLLRELGRGGMGTVHLALDVAGGRECALKRLHGRSPSTGPDPLRDEFDLLAHVRHPALVEVFELGTAADGTRYLTMEYVPGRPADAVVQPGDWRALAYVATQVVGGLEALHAAGVVHGDIKPSNVLVTAAGDGDASPGVRLLDFGLAVRAGTGEGHRGTPGFAAPELARGEAAGVASDLYGLGAMLYALSTGRAAFATGSPRSALQRQQAGPPPAVALDEAGLPPAFVQLVLRLMAAEPAERPASAAEVRLELERIAPGSRRPLAERLRSVRVVGRAAELARIDRWLAREGREVPLLRIGGPPGVGRTTLLGEVARRAALAGRTVVRVAGAPGEDPAGFARALVARVALREPGPGADGEPGPPARLAALAHTLVTGARERAGDGPPPLVLLDDAHVLHPDARAFVRMAVLHPQARALRWLWSERDGSGLADEPGLGERATLAPLDPADVSRLVAARLLAEPPAALLEHVRSRAGGHPGLVVELLVAAVAAGAIREGELGVLADPDRLRDLSTPTDYETSRIRHLAALPAGLRDAAAAMAILARPATEAEIRALAPGAGVDAASLGTAGFASRDDDGRWLLAPPGLAGPVADALPPDVRATLHRAAAALPGSPAAERFRHRVGAGETAAALEQAEIAWREDADASLARTAADLADAAGHATGVSWHARAGEAFHAQGLHPEAIRHLERAAEGADPGLERARRFQLLALSCLRTGRLERVEQAVTRGLEHADTRVRALLLVVDAGRLSSAGDSLGSLARSGEALEAAEASGDDEAIANAAMARTQICLVLGRYAEGETLALRAVECSSRTGNRSATARALINRAVLAAARSDTDAAASHYREALDLCERHDLEHAAEDVRSNLGAFLVECGRWSDALRVFTASLRSARVHGRGRAIAVATLNLAMLDGLAGHSRRALRRAREAVALTRAHAAVASSAAWRAWAQAQRLTGRPAAAWRSARRALALAVTSGSRREQRWCRVELARLASLAGRWSAVSEHAAAGLEGRPIESAPGAILAAFESRAAMRRRDGDRARAMLTEAEAWLEGRTLPWAAAHVSQARAELTLRSGDAHEGTTQARGALEAFAALPAPAERAAAALEFARLAMADGSPSAPVAEWLRMSATIRERLGDHAGRERALALALEWTERTSVPAAAGRHEHDLLRSVGGLLDSLSDLPALTRRAMRMVVEHLDAERGVLLLLDEATGQLVPAGEHGRLDPATRDRALGWSRHVVERVTRSGGSLLSGDAPSDPDLRSQSVVDLGLRSIVCVPMFAGGRLLGAVYLDDSRQPDAFGPEDRGLLEGFAQLMGIAIEKSRGAEEVRRDNERLVGENLSLRRQADGRFQPANMVGTSRAMREVMSVVERAARTNSTVLVTGENGTGKELIARILHHAGARRDRPFVTVNCAAITGTLLESELFGILPNVATGVRGRDGRFVQANGGTLFLDEIGDMPLEQQVALLSALTSREVTPVGGGRPIAVDVRVVAATNRDLQRRIAEGQFREDLYYRLNVVPIEVPPLRERKADVPALAHHFAERFAAQQERSVPRLSPEFLAAIMRSDWPGNVRQLQNYLERVMAMTPGNVLRPVPAPPGLDQGAPRLRSRRGQPLREMLAEAERRLIREALARADDNQSRAARELGLTEQSLRRRLQKHADEDSRRERRIRRIRRN